MNTHVPNDQSLPVIRITIVVNGNAQYGYQYVIRDNGGDFPTASFAPHGNRTRDDVRQMADGEATRRMEHYTHYGYAVEQWATPS